MSTSTSIRKIKIPGLTPGALPRKEQQHMTTTTQTKPKTKTGNDVLVEIASYLARKYKILPTWDHSRADLFEQLKIKSESKCVLELFHLCKKSARKKSSDVPHEKDSIVKKKKIFRGTLKQRKRNSSKKRRSQQADDDEKQENTITEAAQRSA